MASIRKIEGKHGTAYKNVLALETAKGKATTTGNAWRAEKIIYQIQILEMEI